MNHTEHHHLPIETRRIALIGLAVGVGMILAFLVWASFATLESAALARGEVIPAGNIKTIQHLDGGSITEILVRDGDRVKQGQELMRLDESEIHATLAILKSEQESLRALTDRLISERDGKEAPPRFSSSLSESVRGQMRIFEGRREALFKALEVGRQRIRQSQEEIAALESEAEALKASIKLTTEEVNMLRQLFSEGYASRRQLLQPEAKLAQLQGMLGRNTADISRARQKIAEIQAEFDKLRNDWRNNVLEELQRAGDDLTATQEKVRVAEERLARRRIVAPQDGIVNGLKYTTEGGVIPPGGVVMDLVPTSGKLVVEARISPDDIDVVLPGLVSHVRLTAYKKRTHGTLRGTVTYVSADSFRDSTTGAIFYKAHIEVNSREELEGVGPVEIKPGMLADVEIVTGKRSILRYLFDPIIDSLNRAFKEQ